MKLDEYYRVDPDVEAREDRRTLLVAGIVIGCLSLAVAIVMLYSAVASAQTPVTGLCGFARVMTPPANVVATGSAAFQEMTATASAQSPTLPTINQGGPVVGAIAQVVNGIISYRVDGTAPTATSGTFAGPNDTLVSANPVSLEICGSDLRNFQFIRATGAATASTVNFRYYVPGS